jgi:hypothetical protein
LTKRTFTAVAMPQGDAARGLRGPGVLLSIREEGVTADFYWIDLTEAAALRRQLASAEEALALGERFHQERARA